MRWTIPNILTVLRLLAAPGVALAFVLLPRPAADWVSVVLFVVAALTDYIDGRLARAWKQESNFGRMLDPIADKAMVVIALAVIVGISRVNPYILFPVAFILLREVFVSGLREYLAALKVSVPVTRIAKWKTTIQMVAIAFLLAGPAGDTILPYTTEIGIGLLWIAAALTIYTGYDYFRAGLRHIVDEE